MNSVSIARPNCPFSPFPHTKISPFSVKQAEKMCPAATFITELSKKNSILVIPLYFAPSVLEIPSCPSSPQPKLNTFPSSSTIKV